MVHTCCFTGHRPQVLPWRFQERDPRCQDLKLRLNQAILQAVQERQVCRFLSGMALGVDIWAAEAVLALSSQYPVVLDCVLPCRDQAVRWRPEDQRRYREILTRCHQVICLQERYTPDCFDLRNRYMVDHSDLMIAVWNGSPSGTGKTIAYARSKSLPIQLLRP